MSDNITRAEARERGALIDVSGYTVDLDLTTGPSTFRSTTRVEFSCARPGASTWIDLIAEPLESAVLNGRPLPLDSFDGFRLPLPGLAADNVLEVTADCRYMNTGEGLHRFVDPVDGEVYLYSQFQTADARRMYACFEQPDLKAAFALTATAPEGWQVVSNGAPLGDPQPAGAGRARWAFARTGRMSTYITALVAGPYYKVTDEYVGRFGTYPLGVYCRNSLTEHLDHAEIFELTKQGFAFFEQTFGLGYPFGKYDQLFVPEFNAGAMENAGCVTFLEDYVFRSRVTRASYEQRANTILHEMAHMWFGDLVTMRWWDDLWLNESFAEWASHHANAEATKYTEAWTTFANVRKAWAYRQDQLPSTHPIAADMVDLDAVRVNFDGITYAKGASALKQLVAWVGLEPFLAGLRAYFAEHAWGSTELSDLLGHLAAASGRDLSGWAQEWLQTSGVNLLRPLVQVGPDGAYTSVVLEQEPPAAPVGLAPVLRSHRVRLGLYELRDGSLVRDEVVELDVTGAATQVPELVGRRQPDLLLVNDDDLTFAKVRLDERSLGTVTEHMGALHDSLARALIWGAAWDMTRDAELTCGQYVDLVIAGLPAEEEIAGVQVLLRQARTAIDSYAAPANRPVYARRLATALKGWVLAAEPGSDRQLALVRAWSAVAESPGDLGLIAGLLEGGTKLAGLVVDTDLRWTLLHRLVVTGTVGAEVVEAEALRDPTAAGARQRALALASAPDPAAKADAWRSAFETDDLPNAVLDATMAGFAQMGQEDLLRPYRDRYFAGLGRVWQERTAEMAAGTTSMLFPFALIEPQTLEAADAYLAGGSGPVPPSAARLVAEGRDTVARCLRCREADGAAQTDATE